MEVLYVDTSASEEVLKGDNRLKPQCRGQCGLKGGGFTLGADLMAAAVAAIAVGSTALISRPAYVYPVSMLFFGHDIPHWFEMSAIAYSGTHE